MADRLRVFFLGNHRFALEATGSVVINIRNKTTTSAIARTRETSFKTRFIVSQAAPIIDLEYNLHLSYVYDNHPLSNWIRENWIRPSFRLSWEGGLG